MSRDYRRKNKISGQFSWRTIAMMESPAFQVLSLSGRRVLDRLEIEHAHHGGNDNGHLPVTYDQFIEYGIHRNAVCPAIREIEALGFVQITERGRAGNAEWRRPNKFRLTYRQAGRAAITDEWRNIKTIEEAEVIAATARKASKQKHFPVSVNDNFHPRNRYRKARFHTPETDTTGHTPETGTTSISRDLGQEYEGKGIRHYTLRH
jgi:hypothetical protein